MPEGPTILIMAEELQILKNKVILDVAGNTKLDKDRLLGKKILDIFSYGKYANFQLSKFGFRIHLMMFGSYLINEDKGWMTPRLMVKIKDNYVNFYSCAIKFFETDDMRAMYDYSTDIMSKKWDKKVVMAKIKEQHPTTSIDDILMDQTVFTGVGNIIKNEILFQKRLLPSTLLKEISPRKLSSLVDATRAFALLFYELKKKYILKKNLQIYRKKECPVCGGKVTHIQTGKRKRISHFCTHCQK